MTISHDELDVVLDPAALPEPHSGSPVVIVPTDGEEPVAGEVQVWSRGAGGMVVTARVDVGEGAAWTLNGRQVWVRARAPEAMIVVRAVAQVVSGLPEQIELTGVAGLAVEPRRTAPRARLERTILLLRDGAPARGTWTLDLSSSGCRVRLDPEQPLLLGDRVQTVISGAEGEPMWLLSEVVRIDLESGEAALHFVEVDDSDRNTLERDVLTWLDQRRPA